MAKILIRLIVDDKSYNSKACQHSARTFAALQQVGVCGTRHDPARLHLGDDVRSRSGRCRTPLAGKRRMIIDRTICFTSIVAFFVLASGCDLFVPTSPPMEHISVAGPEFTDPILMSTYVSEQGHFSIQYPKGYSLYLEAIPGVDGVVHPLPESAIAILSPSFPNFLLTIKYVSLPRALSLAEFASESGQAYCDLDSAASQEVLIGDQTSLLFSGLPCGPYGSHLFLLLHGTDGYLMILETHQSYDEVSDAVMRIISTFQYLGADP